MQEDHGIAGDLMVRDTHYRDAAITLCTLVQDGNYHLVFGLVTPVPFEEPGPSATQPMSTHFKWRKKTTRLYFQRWIMSFESSCQWYRNAMSGDLFVPNTDNEIRYSNTPTEQEPAWPSVVVEPDVPFAHGGASLHSLYSGDHPILVTGLTGEGKALEWMSERLHFELSAYPEFLGSLHFLAPDPILRSLNHRLGRDEDGREFSEIELIGRTAQSVHDLTLIVQEMREHGPIDIRPVPVTSPYLRIYHFGRVDQVGLSVRHNKLGLLRHSPPLPFLRTITVETTVRERKRRVSAPSNDGGRDEVYDVMEESPAGIMLLGDNTPSDDPAIRLARARRYRAKLAEAERQGQKLFFGSEREARDSIREIVGAARERVMICDPYFSSVELFTFALATRRVGLKVIVVTSALHLTKEDSIDSQCAAGDQLQDQLDNLPSDIDIEVKVLTGDKPALHDRFLVIDQNVWFSGNSLNNIGERLSLIIKLPHPEPIIEALDDLMASGRCMPFEEWIVNRRANREAPNS